MEQLPLWDGPAHDIPEGIDTLVESMNGTRLCVQVFGTPDAPLQVQLEGRGGQLVNVSRQFCIDLAAAGFRVVRVDNRDIGRSQRFPGVAYDLADMAEDVAGLIEVFGEGPATVCGRSMGGMVAQLVALDHPRLVGALGLFSTAPRSSRVARSAPPSARHLAEADWVEAYVSSALPLAGSLYPFDERELAALGRLLYVRDHDPAGKQRQDRAMAATPDWSDRLGRIAVPTAILHGDEDAVIPLSEAESLHRLIPGSSLRVLRGVGHHQPRQLDGLFVETCAGLGHAAGSTPPTGT
ncbi:Pimeloyl-ACP methyl ester carboxylesterase [Raineyella antarctica]|uniref:Pimeloyl-ACP methyl ester carboxylesterase n=1 Tax=Raineyella antarctica TaxID=1577474 RepID=A0A1G6GCT4_9ACTN|nr:alpha/beta hydrolase [Raineyella antarctica]SDB79812.1 Pimeloyl-ACP methyl ester carboxylesterase [Raineyella antarctica]